MTSTLPANRLLILFLFFIAISMQMIATEERDAEVLNRLVSCMNRSVYSYAVDWGKIKFPLHDADEHYADLLRKTARLRQLPVHRAAGYAGKQLSCIDRSHGLIFLNPPIFVYTGPWIENLFIQRFIDKPLSSFRGMIPLFVQFVRTVVYLLSVLGIEFL